MIENSIGNQSPRQALTPAVICAGCVLAINAAMVCTQADARFGWGAMRVAVLISPLLNFMLAIVCVASTPVIRRLVGQGASLVVYVATAIALPLFFFAFQVALFAGFWVRSDPRIPRKPTGAEPLSVFERLERLQYFDLVALEDLRGRLIALHTLPTVALLAGIAGCLLTAALLIRRDRSGRSTRTAHNRVSSADTTPSGNRPDSS